MTKSSTLLTEAQAVHKLCPVRSDCLRDPLVGNSMPGASMCLVTACMAWRWRDDGGRRVLRCMDEKATAEPDRPESVPASWEFVPFNPDDPEYAACWKQPAPEAAAARRGYCGLAGVPA